jgi:carboxymethylenebutenolidase
MFSVPEQVIENLRAPLLVLQGDSDQYREFLRNAKTVEPLAQKHNKVYELVVYRGADHQFDFDDLPRLYDARASRDAWTRTVAFLNRHLRQ